MLEPLSKTPRDNLFILVCLLAQHKCGFKAVCIYIASEENSPVCNKCAAGVQQNNINASLFWEAFFMLYVF